LIGNIGATSATRHSIRPNAYSYHAQQLMRVTHALRMVQVHGGGLDASALEAAAIVCSLAALVAAIVASRPSPPRERIRRRLRA
jgi:hypothetical protein